MSEGVFTLVGCTPRVPNGVCVICDGDGELAITDRASYYPEKYPDEMEMCKACKGLGGKTAADGERGRAFSAAYKKALFEEE